MANNEVYTIPGTAASLGIDTGFNLSFGDMTAPASSSAQSANCQIAYTFTWQPANGNDPAPPTVKVVITIHHEQSYDIYKSNGETGTITVNVGADATTFPALTITKGAPFYKGSADTNLIDMKEIKTLTVTNNIATLTVPLSASATTSTVGAQASASAFDALAYVGLDYSFKDAVLTSPDPTVFPTKGSEANKYTYDVDLRAASRGIRVRIIPRGPGRFWAAMQAITCSTPRLRRLPSARPAS
jgi:hypothetical protein